MVTIIHLLLTLIVVILRAITAGFIIMFSKLLTAILAVAILVFVIGMFTGAIVHHRR